MKRSCQGLLHRSRHIGYAVDASFAPGAASVQPSGQLPKAGLRACSPSSTQKRDVTRDYALARRCWRQLGNQQMQRQFASAADRRQEPQFVETHSLYGPGGGSDDDDEDPAIREDRKANIKRMMAEAQAQVSHEREEERKMYAVLEKMVAEASEVFHQGDPAKGLSMMHDGIAKAAEELGTGNIQLVPLWDHLAMLAFVSGNIELSEKAAQTAVDIAKSHRAQGENAVLAPAVVSVRLGVIRAVQGKYKEAREILQHARKVMAEHIKKDFEAQGEATYYDALCGLKEATNVNEVHQWTPQLLQGIRELSNAVTPEHPLVAVALMSHQAAWMDLPKNANMQDNATVQFVLALLQQHLELELTQNPRARPVVVTRLQIATLLYGSGRLKEASSYLSSAKEIVRYNKKREGVDEDEAMLMEVDHRAGMVAALQNDVETAADLLQRSGEYFEKKIGPNNPLSCEACYAAGRMQLIGLLAGDYREEDLTDGGHSKGAQGESEGGSKDAEGEQLDAVGSVVKLMSDSLDSMAQQLEDDHVLTNTLRRDFAALQAVLEGGHGLEEVLAKHGL